MLFLTSVVVILVAEYFASVRWVASYFRIGIPVYCRRITGIGLLPEKTEELLNSITEGWAPWFLTPLVFRRIALRQWAVRQRSFRFSLMHGRLATGDGNSDAKVVGYVNWWVLSIVATAITISFRRGDWLTAAMVTGLCFLLYLGERTMYKRLVDCILMNMRAGG